MRAEESATAATEPAPEPRSARFLVLAGLVCGAALLRLIPHPPNFTPMGALALFGGAQFKRARWAFAVVLAAMLLSDGALQWLTGRGFYSGTVVVYGSFLAVTALGRLLQERRRPLAIGAASLAGALLFFVVTNFAVWLGAESLYPRTAAGLATCYAAALPFFGWTLAGDLAYAALLFGVFALAQRRFPALRPAAA